MSGNIQRQSHISAHRENLKEHEMLNLVKRNDVRTALNIKIIRLGLVYSV